MLRRIRENDQLKDLPVIVLSARKQDRDIVEALELGASDYMTKPFILDELVARLARLMSAANEAAWHGAVADRDGVRRAGSRADRAAGL